MRNPTPTTSSRPGSAGSPSNITIAVDAEINMLERRLDKLQEIRRLASELDTTRLPKAATPSMAAEQVAPTTSRRRRARRPSPTAPDIVETVRDVLADGPASMNAILTALGRSNTPAIRATVQTALEQLGATVVARNRSGGPAYGLPRDPPSDTHGSEDPEEGEQLRQIVKEIVRKQVGCSDQEIQYQLRKRYGIEISLTDAHRERQLAVNGAAT